MNQYPQSSSMYSTYQFNHYQRPRLPINQWKRSLGLLSDMVSYYKVRHLIDPENVLYSLLAVDLHEVRLTQRLVRLEQHVPLPRLSSIHDLCYRGGYSFRSRNWKNLRSSSLDSRPSDTRFIINRIWTLPSLFFISTVSLVFAFRYKTPFITTLLF